MLYRDHTKAGIVCSNICHHHCDVAGRIVRLKPTARQARILPLGSQQCTYGI